jgi:adenylate cyclase
MTNGPQSFIAELKRRHVFKIGVIYIAYLVAVLSFASDIKNALNLPDYTVTLIIVLSVLGLPVALIIAWAFELTPQGIRRTPEVDAAAVAAKNEMPPKPDSELASIAVLPFQSVSSAEQEAFLATAIPLELNNTLSRVHQLRIVSSQSSFAHSRNGKDLKMIASELGVSYVISGSVSQLGEDVRVIAELYDAMSDTLLWTERFDMRAEQVFETERRIAEAAAMAFGGERLRLEVERARQGQTTDQAAWELVQKARGYLLNYAPDSVDAAIPLLEKAVALDPAFTVGYAQLGLVTAEKTLNAVGDDPEADRAAALAAIARAESLAPNDSVVLRSAGVVQAYCGHNAEAIDLLRQATNLAPYDLGAWGYFGWPLVNTGKREDLEELHGILDRLLEHGTKHPGYPYWLFHKSVAHCCEGDCERALDYVRRATAAQPRFALGWMHQANVHGLLGQVDEAREAAARCLNANPRIDGRYYETLMRVFSDNEDVVACRVAGLRSAGLIGEAA